MIDRISLNGCRYIVSDDRPLLEETCRLLSIPILWIRTRGRKFYLRLWGRYKGRRPQVSQVSRSVTPSAKRLIVVVAIGITVPSVTSVTPVTGQIDPISARSEPIVERCRGYSVTVPEHAENISPATKRLNALSQVSRCPCARARIYTRWNNITEYHKSIDDRIPSLARGIPQPLPRTSSYDPIPPRYAILSRTSPTPRYRSISSYLTVRYTTVRGLDCTPSKIFADPVSFSGDLRLPQTIKTAQFLLSKLLEHHSYDVGNHYVIRRFLSQVPVTYITRCGQLNLISPLRFLRHTAILDTLKTPLSRERALCHPYVQIRTTLPIRSSTDSDLQTKVRNFFCRDATHSTYDLCYVFDMDAEMGDVTNRYSSVEVDRVYSPSHPIRQGSGGDRSGSILLLRSARQVSRSQGELFQEVVPYSRLRSLGGQGDGRARRESVG